MLSDRLRELRKKLNLTQKEFGEKIDIKTSSYSDIENGRRNLTERNMTSICREFNVNEQWLRTGEGEMFVEDDKALLEKYANKYNFSDLDKAALKLFSELSPEDRNIAEEFLLRLVNGVMNNKDLYERYKSHYENKDSNIITNKSEKYSSEFGIDNNIDKEVESYRRELEYEKAAKISGASQPLEDEKHA
jgi:transcriptional regulator with XRE-family HTH domain